jgi:hypothetical protein
MSFSLAAFDLQQMLRCGLDLRQSTRASVSMEAAADAVVRYFYETMRDEGSGARQCPLVRFYKTHTYGDLEPEQKQFAANMLGSEPAPEMRCLVLLASAGDRPEWNDRRLSRGHQAIPLSSVSMVEGAPMIAQLVRQLGLDIAQVVSPDAEVVGSQRGKTYNIFFVPEARGHPAIPAQQDFVVPYGIRSVVGCGGMHISGDLYAAILFSRVSIPPASAERFRNIALDLKLCIAPFREDRVFTSQVVDTLQPAAPG